MEAQVKIYTLADPNTGLVRYVGKTQRPIKDRKSEHVYFAKRSNKTRTHKWVRSLLKKGQRPIFEVIDQCALKDWKIIEQYWISQFKAWGFNLTNHSIGGEGAFGRKWTKQERENRKPPSNKRPVFIADNEGNPIQWFETLTKGKEVTHCHMISKDNEILPQSITTPVYSVQPNGFGKIFKSITEAARYYKTHSSNVLKVMKGERTQAAGVKFYSL